MAVPELLIDEPVERDPVFDWPDELREAFVAAWAELTSPPKSSTADAGRFTYTYADLAAVDRSVRPTLARHGLATTVDVLLIDHVAYVSTSLLHRVGVGRTSWLSMPFAGDVQSAGSTVTYLRRYQLLALFGLAPEDDDGATALQRRQQRPQTQRDDVARVRSLLRQLGVTGDDAASLIAFEIGHEIERADELTPDEALVVIERLEERLARSTSTDSADGAADPAGSDTAPSPSVS